MAGGPSVAVLRDIQTLFDTGTASGLSDRQLLERFESGRDASAEAAFEVLVLRHGPMVLRVCHNVLGDATDAQDAFQATFLVLVKRAARFAGSSHWEAGCTAWRAGWRPGRGSRRHGAARPNGVGPCVSCTPSIRRNDGTPDHAEFGPVIQEEVRRLPEKYRAVVALATGRV